MVLQTRQRCGSAGPPGFHEPPEGLCDVGHITTSKSCDLRHGPKASQLRRAFLPACRYDRSKLFDFMLRNSGKLKVCAVLCHHRSCNPPGIRQIGPEGQGGSAGCWGRPRVFRMIDAPKSPPKRRRQQGWFKGKICQPPQGPSHSPTA